jgi:hypothetical protein
MSSSSANKGDVADFIFMPPQYQMVPSQTMQTTIQQCPIPFSAPYKMTAS